MRESYCGLCDDCRLGNWDFLETVSRLQEYVGRFRADWWLHCFPEGNGFDFQEFRKGLEWFLSHTECPGCKGGRGLENCPIRTCARERQLEHCYLCADLQPCDKFAFLMAEFPQVKTNLLRRQLKYKARQFHLRRELEQK
jgi:hypothetical protein